MFRLIFSAAVCCMVSLTSANAADPVTVPSPAAPTSIPANRPPAEIPAPQPVIAELKDGSKIEIDADGSVWVLELDGGKNPAPDGTLTLKDGTPFTVRDGKRIGSDD